MILKVEDALKPFRRTPARLCHLGGDPDCEAHRDLRGSYSPSLVACAIALATEHGDRKKQNTFEIHRCLRQGGSLVKRQYQYLLRRFRIQVSLLSILLTLHSCSQHTDQLQNDIPEKDSTEIVIIEKLFGIPVDSFNIFTGKVKRNQNLAGILTDHGVPYPKIQEIIDHSGDIFDFRKVKSGNPYYIFSEKDSNQSVRYFVYVNDQVNCYVFSLGDSAYIYHESKEIVSDLKTVSGTITNSLWQTMIDGNMNPELAVELSEIFAWTIDFFGLQKGDSFKVIYEEQFVDSVSIGISRILAALFNHSGEEFYAIPFRQNGREDYFDENGNSLRKAFLKAPLRFSRISSRFSHSRLHPILKIRRPHHGIDYAAPVGTPVHAIGDGKIIEARYKGDAGRLVKIKHNSIYSTSYLHLSGYGPGIKTGRYVKQGDVIGYVGSTGLSTGPHLDFRFYKNGIPVDPLKVKAPPVEPVNEENLAVYNKISKVTINLLNTIK